MKRKLKITIKDDHNHYALIEQVNNRENEINRGIFLDKDQYEQLRQHFVVWRSEQFNCLCVNYAKGIKPCTEWCGEDMCQKTSN